MRFINCLMWTVCIFACVALICLTLYLLYTHPYTVVFEMDNNTLEAVKAIQWEYLSGP